MSLWTRIGLAISALVEGEPLSSVLEKLKTPPERTVAFTIAVIALGAKMAKADGQVTRDEVAAFRRIFTIPAGEEAQAARLFNLARTDVAGFDSYARQVSRMFRDRPEVLIDLMDGLVEIAVADGEYHPGEDAYLVEVAEIFGLDSFDLRRIKARHMPDITDPYMVLGVEHDASPEEIRKQWYQLVRDLHPDRMIARGVPIEAQKLAEQRLAAINAAYETIIEERSPA